MSPTQEELDAWLLTGPEDRQTMRTGALPAGAAGLVRGGGCSTLVLLPFALVFGFCALLLARRGALPFLPASLSPLLFAAAVAAVAFAFGLLALRSHADRSARLAQVTVTREVLELVPGDELLRSSDGRTFRALLARPELRELRGRYAAYYVDFSQLPGAAGARGKDERLLLALEIAGSPHADK